MYSILHSDSVACSPVQGRVTVTYRGRGRGDCVGFVPPSWFLMMKKAEGLKG